MNEALQAKLDKAIKEIKIMGDNPNEQWPSDLQLWADNLLKEINPVQSKSGET